MTPTDLIKRSAYSQTMCEHPRTIINKYTGEIVTVRCGRCDACRISKANKSTARIEYIRKNSSCSFFGTLTYDDEHLPVMSFDNRNFDVALDDDFYDVKGTFFAKHVLAGTYYSRKLSHRAETLCVYDTEHVMDLDLSTLSQNELGIIRKGYHSVGKEDYHPYQLGYLRKADLQKFFKRLRKRLKSISDANIYYFACGEYGPQSLRPHYHFVISCNTVLSYHDMLACVLGSWPLGRVDLQTVNSSAASYVGGYLTSTSHLPSFLCKKQVAPFHVSSREADYFKKNPLEMEQTWYKVDAHQRVEQCDRGPTVLPLPMSYTNRYYPKCSGFSDLTLETLNRRWQTFNANYIRVPVNKLTNDGRVTFFEEDVPVSMLSKLSSTRISNVLTVTAISPTYYYDFLWHNHVCDLAKKYDMSPYDVLYKIYKWHKDEELYKLNRFYKTQESFSSPFDVLSNLLQYPQIFAVLNASCSYKDLPQYLQKTFDLQGLTSFLYDKYGHCKIDVNNFAKLDNYDAFISAVRIAAAERVKTKGVNDLYNPFN